MCPLKEWVGGSPGCLGPLGWVGGVQMGGSPLGGWGGSAPESPPPPSRTPGSLSPQVNYTQPVVAVQFANATANMEHYIECRLNAAGLRTDDERDKFAGRVAFRLRINRD